MLKTNLLGYGPEDSLDPAKLRFVQEYFAIDNMTAKLVGTGKDGQYINDLAESLEFSDDKKTIKIKIKNAKFSDGSPITATDVAKSIKRAVILGSPHANIKNLWVGSESLKHIDDSIPGIESQDDRQLTLRMNRATKEILFFLSLTDLAVLHRTQYQKDDLKVKDWIGITSGAYRASHNSDGKFALLANKESFYFSPNMPATVVFGGYKGDDVINRLKNETLDFGIINFKDYIDNQKVIENVKAFDVVGEKTDGVVYIGLNIKSKLFRSVQNRQWLQKKMIENFDVENQYKKVSTKAFQFFLPNAKGYVDLKKVKEALKDTDTQKVPKDLLRGIKIRSIEGMSYYIPPGLAQSLTKALGIPVVIDLSVSGKDYMKFTKNRDYDATIMGYGMSYKVIGEALNLQYLSEDPPLLDPTGKIKALLTKYQNEEDDNQETSLISQIIQQMVADSECIPVYYFASPFFIKKEKVKMNDINLDESIKFYKAQIL